MGRQHVGAYVALGTSAVALALGAGLVYALGPGAPPEAPAPGPEPGGPAPEAAPSAASPAVVPEAGDAPEEPVLSVEQQSYLAARRAALTTKDLEALWRMVQSENPHEPEPTHVEMVWAAINRAFRRHVSVFDLLEPKGVPSHQIGGNPPFATWEPAGPAGPLPTPEGAAAVAERWVNQNPALVGATEWFEPALQDQLAAKGAMLRAARDAGTKLTERQTQIARYIKTADDFRASRGGKSLGMVGPLEFFRA